MVWLKKLDKYVFKSVHTYTLRPVNYRKKDKFYMDHVDEVLRVHPSNTVVEKIGPCMCLRVLKDPSRPVILYAHGRGEDLGVMDRYKLLEIMSDVSDCSVIGFEYPGYGYDSFSNVSSELVVQNLVDLYIQVMKMHAIEPSSVIFYGYSLGSGVVMKALYTILKEDISPPGMVILEGEFTSLLKANIPSKKRFARYLGVDLYRNDRAVKYALKYNVPVYFIHGKDDTVCPFQATRKMSRGFPHLWLDNRNHYNVRMDPKYAVYMLHITSMHDTTVVSARRPRMTTAPKGTETFVDDIDSHRHSLGPSRVPTHYTTTHDGFVKTSARDVIDDKTTTTMKQKKTKREKKGAKRSY